MRAQPVASRLIDQAVMNRVPSKLESVGNTQLIEDVVQMIFDCLLADEKLLADFSVTEALRHQLHNFLFAVAEQWFVPALSRLRRALESVDYLGGHTVVEPDFAVVNFLDALQQQVARRLL